jgi:hypothetical protein
MTKKACFLTLFVSLAICTLNLPFAISGAPHLPDGATVSITGYTPGNDAGNLGSFTYYPGNQIQGAVELTVPFEIVPGGEFNFDMTIWNPVNISNGGDYAIVLEFPDEQSMTLDEGSITLEGKEAVVFNYNHRIPVEIETYGRYTLKLFIDDLLADFLQFDLHSRSLIEVRWDDGVMSNAWAFVYILSEGDLYWPWPDDIHQDILLQVFDNDGPGGMPGTLLWSDVSQVTPGTSHAVAYPGIPISSAFYIANDQLTDYPECEGQGVDEAVNHPDQMYTRIDNVWENAGGSYGGDFMIWGVGSVGGRRIVVGNPPAE